MSCCCLCGRKRTVGEMLGDDGQPMLVCRACAAEERGKGREWWSSVIDRVRDAYERETGAPWIDGSAEVESWLANRIGDGS